jgi:hypothetical protein
MTLATPILGEVDDTSIFKTGQSPPPSTISPLVTVLADESYHVAI